MAKRRTRKQKESARHQFTIEWKPGQVPSGKKGQPEPKKASAEPVVKGQFKKPAKSRLSKAAVSKKAMESAKAGDVAKIKREIIKSLILASLILSLEIMLYLARTWI
jgi:hypothetical protein